ncbi:MAG: sialidase family protein [Candidatus Acidiferrum sp.]
MRALLFYGIALTACLTWRSYTAASSKQVRDLANPALPGSVAPSVSATPDGKVLLSWLEPADPDLILRFAIWDAKGWSAPETVVRRSDFDVYAEAPPSVLKLANGVLLSLWGQKIKTGGKWDGSYLFSSVSSDRGKHWSTAVRVHSDTSLSEHSFSSVIPMGSDRAVVVWLDARDYEAKHRYRLMSAVIDSKGTVSDEETVDEDTCTCCPTAFVKTTAGAVAAYRGHNPQEIRDIKVARLADGNWQAPYTVHDDLWKINGCPVNGPALASNGNRVAIVWFTGANDKPEVKMAMSDDHGSTFRAPITLDSPDGEDVPVGHVAVSLLDDGSAIAIWLHHRAVGTEVVGERISTSGQRSGTFTIASGSDTGLGYPRVQRVGKQLIVSWSGRTGKDVKTAILGY